MSSLFSGLFNKVIGSGDKADSKLDVNFDKDDQKSFRLRLDEISGEINRENAAEFYNVPFIRTDKT